MARVDPYLSFRFRIESDRGTLGGFSRIKGMTRETRVESYREGGRNDHEHKLATLTTYGNLILERGLADTQLWDWHQEVIEGRIQRNNVTVILQDTRGGEPWRWLFALAYPVKWSASDFEAGGSQILVESVELAHHGISRGDNA